MNNLVQIFLEAAEKFAHHTAIIHQNQHLTYAELRSSFLCTAEDLKNRGIKKGTRVLVFIPMSVQLYQTVLALFYLGAVVVFIDEWANRKRVKKALEVVSVEVLIAPRKYLWLSYLLKPFSKIKSKIAPKSLYGNLFQSRKHSPIECHPVEVEMNDSALITFTTGSTGLPKAADRTHGFLREQFRILHREIGATPEDKCLVTLPIVLLSILGTGATGIIAKFNQKRPEDLDASLQMKIIKDQKVTLLIASPFYVKQLAMSHPSGYSLRKILTGGAPVFPDLAQKITSAFPTAESWVAYGSTEAEPISVIGMHEIEVNRYGLAVGPINEEIDLRIIKITVDEIVLDSEGWDKWESEFGEIVVAGPHVLTHYYNSEEAFKMNKIVDGDRIWHRTGDSGRMVGDQLYLNGRCSQLVQKGMEYESLFLQEYKISQIEGVKIGTILEGKVIVELEKSMDREEVKTHTEKQLGEHQIEYQEIIILSSIPRDPRHHSKIDYERLRLKI